MMTLDRLKTLIDAYGATPDRWPAEERMAARRLLATSAEARAYAQAAAPLDGLLDRVPLRPTKQADAATIAALLVQMPPRAAQARRGSTAAWSRFAFGWPNFAALAAAGVAGFLIGWSNLSATYSNRDMLDLMTPVTALDEPL